MEGRKFDVIVIGAGAVGLACAYFLSRAGRNVCVIDANTPGSGASSGNAGLITPSHALPLCRPGAIQHVIKSMVNRDAPLLLRPKALPGMLGWLSQFARNATAKRSQQILSARLPMLRSSRQLTEMLIKQERLSVEWAPTGVMSVVRTAAGFERLSDFVAQANEVGLDAELLEGDALHRREPALRSDVLGGALFKGDAQLQPSQLVNELARLCRERDVVIETGRHVESLNVEQSKVHSAYTNPGLHFADQYVLAAGAWSRGLAKPLGLKLPIQPGKGYSITTKSPEPCPIRALILEERSIAVTPWSDTFRLAGTMEFAGFDDRLDKGRLAALIDGANEYLHEPLGRGEQTEWFGYRPMTPDDMPLIGPVKGVANLTLACGHNMLGMSMAMSSGRLAAELITGAKPHIDPVPFHPGRF